MTGARLRNDEARDTGLRALTWLYDVQAETGMFAPIGSNGFWIRGERRAHFDQQPVEANATISACLDAHRTTGERHWLANAHAAFAWFLGRNALSLSIYDAISGGCRDGLHPDRVNENQGAESTLSFLQALLEIRAAQEVSAHLAEDAERAVS